ncbi:ABC transporter ATP-binding protein [Ligilactobacillus pobuzihii]|nr:ABC transporter ATP-binding protein [Ligilactobacillus pobuzihii]GEN49154.1 sugar ABC transporter ATP-binding protein [Ligilactobacillus pobuzihii]
MDKIEIKHLYKKYPGRSNYTLKDINLSIKDKQFVAIVGPSGCGKSTLLRCFAGLEEINKGEVLVNGKNFDKIDPRNRNVAMVFQDYALYPHMTVFKNMAYNLKIAKKDKETIEQKVTEAAEKLKLTDYLQQKPAQLSGGQRQRVALGRAMVRDPEIFLMDEPLSNLDAKLRVKTRQDIIDLHRQLGTITMYVTHDQAEAMALADQIVVMRDGILMQTGTPAELYDDPHNIFVARFIGSPSMNIFRGFLDSKAQFKVGKTTYNLKNIVPKSLLPVDEQEIFIGFRPEQTRPLLPSEEGKENDKDKFTFKAQLNYAEYMGAYTLLYLEAHERSIVAQIYRKIEGSPHNRQVTMEVTPKDLYFFNADTGQRMYPQ